MEMVEEGTSILEEAVAAALAVFEGVDVTVRERDFDGSRAWTARLLRASTVVDPGRGGLVVRLGFIAAGARPGEQDARTLEFRADRVISAGFDDGRLSVVESERRVTVASPSRAVAEAETEPDAAPAAVDARAVEEVDRALDSLLRDYRGRNVLVRDSRGTSQTGGRLHDVLRRREDFRIVLGDLELDLPHTALRGATATGDGPVLWVDDHQLILRIEPLGVDEEGAEGHGLS